MANSDSFINEVTEEVRRDRLFKLMRRWAWLVILVVLVLVGGAVWTEYRRGQEQAASQAFGDALLQALDLETAEARIAALEAIPTEAPAAGVLRALLIAGEEATAGQEAEAAARLRALAETPGIERRYRDLALLKAHLLDPQDAALARQTLETLAAPGAPYRALALEQQAYLHIRAGEVEAGIAILREIERDQQATPGLQQRAAQLIVALEAGSALVDAPLEEAEDTAPEPVPAAPAPDVEATEAQGAAEETEEAAPADAGTDDAAGGADDGNDATGQ